MKSNILVTGGSGLLGKSLNKLEKNFVYLSSKEVNLLNKHETDQVFGIHNPNIIVHLAAKVGGIKDNIKNPYDFIFYNNMINTNVIDYCVRRKIKLLFASSSCVYPKISTTYPMTEDMVDNGEPEPTNSSYAYSKRFASYMLRSARKQYGLDYCILYFCNLYGEQDNFSDENKSHLVTSLIKKFHDAKMNNRDEVVLLGTGKPLRQFMYAQDGANIILKVLNKNLTGDYNASISDNLSVLEISNIVSQVIGYKGRIKFTGESDGVYRKDICSKKILNCIGGYKFTSLVDGVEKTYYHYKSLVDANI